MFQAIADHNRLIFIGLLAAELLGLQGVAGHELLKKVSPCPKTYKFTDLPTQQAAALPESNAVKILAEKRKQVKHC